MNLTIQPKDETVVTTNEGLQHVTIFVKSASCASKDEAFSYAMEKAKAFLKYPVLKTWVVNKDGFSFLQKNPYQNKQGDYVFLFVEA